MPVYTTVARYRRSAYGVDLSDISDGELRALIETASNFANVLTSAPPGHDFRGGSITDERHPFDLGNVWRRSSGRVYPRHRPIRQLSAFALDISNKIRISFPTDSFYVNDQANFIEVADVAYGSLTGLLLGQYYPVGMTMPVARISYDYGWLMAIDEPLVATSDAGTLAGSVPFWANEPVTVKKNGVDLAAGSFSVDYDEGTVTVSGYDPAATYEASYTARLPAPIEQATRLIVTELIGFRSINASGLLGLSRLRFEEIEISPSARWGFGVNSVSEAPRQLLAPYTYLVIG